MSVTHANNPKLRKQHDAWMTFKFKYFIYYNFNYDHIYIFLNKYSQNYHNLFLKIQTIQNHTKELTFLNKVLLVFFTIAYLIVYHLSV